MTSLGDTEQARIERAKYEATLPIGTWLLTDKQAAQAIRAMLEELEHDEPPVDVDHESSDAYVTIEDLFGAESDMEPDMEPDAQCQSSCCQHSSTNADRRSCTQ